MTQEKGKEERMGEEKKYTPTDKQLRESPVLGPMYRHAVSIEDEDLDKHDEIISLLERLWNLGVK